MLRRLAVPLALWLAALLTLVGVGARDLTADPGPPRVVVIGDVHGAYDSFVEILQRAELIDDRLAWIGGDTLFVQTGDLVDKGPDVRNVMDLLISLQVHAEKSGGRVVTLMGNHEAMNLMGLTRDVDPDAYLAFVDDKSERRRKRAYRDHARLLRRRASTFGTEMPKLDDAAREAWMEEHPPGLVEYLEAMSPEGFYGRWIRTMPAVVKIGDTLALHAGIGPDEESLTAEEINALLQRDIRAFDEGRAELIRRGVVLPSYTWPEMERAIADEFNGYRARAERDQFILEADKAFMFQLADFLEFPGGVLLDPQGPLWFRGFARWTDEEGGPAIDRLATVHEVDAFICSHSPNARDGIRMRFDDRVFLIDTGMLKSVYDGFASALEIRDGRFTAIYPDRELVLIDPGADAER
jgi:hypothetical protein